MKEQIKKFIADNKLDFSGTGSDLNGACVVLAGWCDYKEFDDDDSSEAFQELGYSIEANREFERVAAYAWESGYGDWWCSKQAHDMYIFD